MYIVPVCPPLAAPDNGNIDCSLGDDGEANPGDTCTFTCDDGFELGGSSSRTCGDDGNWDGTDTTCTPGMVIVLHCILRVYQVTHSLACYKEFHRLPIPFCCLSSNSEQIFRLMIIVII